MSGTPQKNESKSTVKGKTHPDHVTSGGGNRSIFTWGDSQAEGGFKIMTIYNRDHGMHFAFKVPHGTCVSMLNEVNGTEHGAFQHSVSGGNNTTYLVIEFSEKYSESVSIKTAKEAERHHGTCERCVNHLGRCGKGSL